MKKESKPKNENITNQEIVESLLLISEASKTLALEIMLLPKPKEVKGGDNNGTVTDEPQ
ncbi:MAG: hypothetical protein WC939_03550 [Acholeplasmataceae bacterium]